MQNPRLMPFNPHSADPLCVKGCHCHSLVISQVGKKLALTGAQQQLSCPEKVTSHKSTYPCSNNKITRPLSPVMSIFNTETGIHVVMAILNTP